MALPWEEDRRDNRIEDTMPVVSKLAGRRH